MYSGHWYGRQAAFKLVCLDRAAACLEQRAVSALSCHIRHLAAICTTSAHPPRNPKKSLSENLCTSRSFGTNRRMHFFKFAGIAFGKRRPTLHTHTHPFCAILHKRLLCFHLNTCAVRPARCHCRGCAGIVRIAVTHALCIARNALFVHVCRLGECRALREWMLQVAHALTTCHSAGVAHRDGEAHNSDRVCAYVQHCFRSETREYFAAVHPAGRAQGGTVVRPDARRRAASAGCPGAGASQGATAAAETRRCSTRGVCPDRQAADERRRCAVQAQPRHRGALRSAVRLWLCDGGRC